MKYLVHNSFKVKTPQGEKIIQAGQVISLPEDKSAALISSGKIEPLRITFEKLFHSHMERMRKLQVPEEIKRRDPKAYETIQETIKKLDIAWVKEDLTAFKLAMERVESLYLEALESLRRVK